MAGQTFTDVQPVAQTFTDVQPADTGTSQPKSWLDSATDLAKGYWSEINPVAGFKGAAQLTSHPVKTYLADAGNRQVLMNQAEAAFKKGDYSTGVAKALYGIVPFLGPQINQAGEDIQKGDVAKGVGESLGIGTAMAAPEAIKGSGIVPKLQEHITNAIKGDTAPASYGPIRGAITQTLPPEMANASVAETSGRASSGGAATQITNAEVLQHAADEGIQLTPAQGLKTAAARTEQTFGEEAAFTGNKIQQAVAKSKGVLNDSLDGFQNRLDPERVGLSSEAAGEHLQNSAEIARSVLKDNVNHAYDEVRNQQADLAGDVQTPLQNFINSQLNVRQPHAAVTRPVFKTAAEQSALDDIQSMLDDKSLQGRASIESLRNLRTNLLEKGNNYGANALSDSGQRIYKIAAGKVDDAIMDGAKGTPFEQIFRDASAQNAKLQQLYNTRGSPLYRILNTDDAAQVTDGILNRSSVHEIETLKGENFDLGPLARQAVQDIRDGGFRVTPNGLGGYPDTFLRSLLGPEATKELYLKSEIARRLAENYNPSGSGKVVLGASQLLHPVAAVAAQAARVRSMPQPATNFLPGGGK